MIEDVRSRVGAWLDERLRPRDRRALRWGALALAPALLWAAVVRPWLGAVEERRDRIASLRTLVRAEAELLATDDRYPAAVETGARRLAAAAPRLLDRRSEGRARAELHQLVEDRARAARVRLTAVRPAGIEAAEPGLSAAALEVQGESDLRGLLELLSSLETAGKLMRVPELQVRSAPDRSDHQVITFRARITGYLLDLERERGPDDASGPRPRDDPGPGAEGADAALSAAAELEDGGAP